MAQCLRVHHSRCTLMLPLSRAVLALWPGCSWCETLLCPSPGGRSACEEVASVKEEGTCVLSFIRDSSCWVCFPLKYFQSINFISGIYDLGREGGRDNEILAFFHRLGTFLKTFLLTEILFFHFKRFWWKILPADLAEFIRACSSPSAEQVVVPSSRTHQGWDFELCVQAVRLKNIALSCQRACICCRSLPNTLGKWPKGPAMEWH